MTSFVLSVYIILGWSDFVVHSHGWTDIFITLISLMKRLQTRIILLQIPCIFLLTWLSDSICHLNRVTDHLNGFGDSSLPYVLTITFSKHSSSVCFNNEVALSGTIKLWIINAIIVYLFSFAFRLPATRHIKVALRCLLIFAFGPCVLNQACEWQKVCFKLLFETVSW